jgi:hypothetical protein
MAEENNKKTAKGKLARIISATLHDRFYSRAQCLGESFAVARLR